MAVVTVTTQPAATVTVTPSSAPNDGLSSASIAGIVVGTLLGTVLLVLLVLYLLRCHRRHKFTRVPNPLPGARSSAGAPRLSGAGSRRTPHFPRHLQKSSISSEPLISPVSWPPIPPTSRVHSPGTPSRSNSVSPEAREGRYSIGQITQVIAAGPISRPAAPAILTIPPTHKPEQPSSSPKQQQTFFVHRMLQSRAQASEAFSLVQHPSLVSVQSTSTTSDLPAVPVDEEQLLADAERTALRDAEAAQRNRESTISGEDGRQDVASTASAYSQNSAPLDHSTPLVDPASGEDPSLNWRRSSRRQPHATELTPVTEVLGTPRMIEGRFDSPSLAAISSLDVEMSHGSASRPTSSVLDVLPLLTSANFGKESTPSGTTAGSISSTAALGSHSSGRASRYPSIAPSTIGLSSQSGSRSDGDTDWRHPPPGLSGLKKLQIGSLRNPHSPVEEYPERGDPSPAADPADPALAERVLAHLRRGTMSSVPEVERRSVVGGGIARIDVAL